MYINACQILVNRYIGGFFKDCAIRLVLLYAAEHSEIACITAGDYITGLLRCFLDGMVLKQSKSTFCKIAVTLLELFERRDASRYNEFG